ncbi:MAG: M56 family metallopeptidase [Verrucomicrobiales bacterium]|nr:M56 family metallopeptidase [Verrucomicrobiales bacterium]
MSGLSLFPYLTEFLAKAGVILLVGFALGVLFRSRSPGWKHQVWMRVFAVGLAVPLMLLFPRWELIPLPGETEASISSVTVSGAERVSPIAAEGMVSVPNDELKTNPIDWESGLLAVWLLGVIVLSLRTLFAWMRLRALCRKARSPDRKLLEIFDALSVEAGTERVSLSVVDEVQTPFAWGLIHPRVFLPSASRDWSSSDLKMILLHELEHVRRRDAIAVLLSRLFLVLNWVNPLAWIAIKQSVRLREEACDSRVVSFGHEAPDYAELLLRHAKSTHERFLQTCSAALAPTAIANTGAIEQRIHMILKSNSSSPPVSELSTVSRILILTLTLLFVLIGMAGSQSSTEVEPTAPELALAAELEKKMESIIIPKLEFSDTPLSDALRFLRQKSVELDVEEKDPAKKGINIILNAPALENGSGLEGLRITLRLSKVPLSEALRYTTNLAQTTMRVGANAVEVGPLVPNSQKLFTEAFEVPGDFTKFGGVNFTAKQVMERAGMKLGEGAAAAYNPATSTLVLRNTRSQIDHAKEFLASVHAGKREEFLNQIEEGWEVPAGSAKKLKAIIIPKVEFQETPLQDALAFLQMRSVELDEDPNVEKRGINIILENLEKVEPHPITLRLTNVPLAEALRYTSELAGFSYRTEEHAVVIFPKDKKP